MPDLLLKNCRKSFVSIIIAKDLIKILQHKINFYQYWINNQKNEEKQDDLQVDLNIEQIFV